MFLLLVFIIGQQIHAYPIKMGLMMVTNRTDLESTIGYATSAGAVVIALDRIKSEQLLYGADIRSAFV